MSPVERAAQIIVFLAGVSWVFICAVPLALGTVEQLLGFHKPKGKP